MHQNVQAAENSRIDCYNPAMSHDASQTHTRPASSAHNLFADEPPTACLTVIAHPDPTRIGEHAVLTPFLSNQSVPLSRLEPHFAPPRDQGKPRYLEDARLSRKSLLLSPLGQCADQGLEIDPRGSSTLVTLDGEALAQKQRLSPDALDRGVVLVLARRVALLLHHTELLTPSTRDHGLIGDSPALVRLREQIERAARRNDPVLLRGETGTGKELVARAIHRLSGRRGKSLSINLGALPRELAAAELFGVARGAHSTADRKRRGYFERAEGGTLLLDEIGETPSEIQVALLRAIEQGEIQSLGGNEPRESDVRVIAATDADLEAAIARGDFRAPLLHRLTTKIEIPPLRERREDIGRLLIHFLRHELAAEGKSELLSPVGPDEPPWLSADLVGLLTRYHWPGNVRELKNVAREIVATSAAQDRTSLPKLSPYVVGEADDRPPASDTYRSPGEITGAELLEALEATEWSVRGAARRLRISASAAYRLCAANPRVPKASELTPTQIEAAAAEHQGNRVTIARALHVSPRALLARLKELDLDLD